MSTENERYKGRPFPWEQPDVSVDIETLALGENAAVINIAVVTRDLSPPKEQQCVQYFNLEEQMEWERDMDMSTLLWHLQNHPKVFVHDLKQMLSATKIITALSKLHLFFEQFENPPRVWMRHPHFDHPIMEALANRAEMNLPWKYWQCEDVHTILNCAKMRHAGEKILLPEKPDNAHDALVDATYQLEIVSRCKTILNC